MCLPPECLSLWMIVFGALSHSVGSHIVRKLSGFPHSGRDLFLLGTNPSYCYLFYLHWDSATPSSLPIPASQVCCRLRCLSPHFYINKVCFILLLLVLHWLGLWILLFTLLADLYDLSQDIWRDLTLLIQKPCILLLLGLILSCN